MESSYIKTLPEIVLLLFNHQGMKTNIIIEGKFVIWFCRYRLSQQRLPCMVCVSHDYKQKIVRLYDMIYQLRLVLNQFK